MTPYSKVYNQDCNIGLADLPDNSIDIILTDPPYKYLKNQKLEVDFDEVVFFNHVKRLLKKDGFIVMFGRGTSFYRWNTMLADLGFQFKEEIVWNKNYTSTPTTPISRIHETVSIHSVSGGINKVRVPYLESKDDVSSICQDIKRLKSALNNVSELDDIRHYLKTGECRFSELEKPLGNGTTVQTRLKERSRGLATLKSIMEGFVEKSIITAIRNHYSAIHPTEKPVRLLERLLALVIKPDRPCTVLDPFMGSGSTGIAAYNMGLDFIGYEIDKEYFEGAEKRFKQATAQQRLFV